MFILVAGLLLLGVYYLFFSEQARARRVGGKTVPGPFSWPLFGNALSLVIGQPRDRFLSKLTEYREKHGSVFQAHLGPEKYIFVTNPEVLEAVLNNINLIQKSRDYDFFRPWVGDSLLLSNGKKWFSRRRLLTPSFHFQILGDFMDVFNDHSRILVKKIKEMGSGKSIDVEPELCKYSLDIFVESGTGLRLDTQLKSHPYLDAVEEIKRITFARFTEPFYRNKFTFGLLKDSKRYNESVAFSVQFTKNCIKHRTEYWEKNKEKIDSLNMVDEFGRKKRMAFMDNLLIAKIDGEPIPEDGILEEVSNFIFAGHDTTSTTMAFIIYNLANNPDKQEKLFQELRKVYGDDPLAGEVTAEKMAESKYLDLCMKESMRHNPTVPMVLRNVPKDMTIGGYFFPKNATIACGFWWLCRAPEYWDEPLKFIPERFDQEVSRDKMNPYTYTPFSAGPRNCIGQRFAWHEMKTCITYVIRNFELEVEKGSPSVGYVNHLVLVSTEGLHVRFKPRRYD